MNSKTTQTKRAAIYVRVSTVDQADGFGLKAQLEETRRYADARGWKVTAEYSDTVSGRKGEDEREGLDAAIRSGLDGDYDVLVVREISRFSRKASDALKIAERLTDAGVEVTDTKGNSSENKLVFTILNAIAEYEADQIKERMVGGRRSAASEGRWIGGSAAFGYEIAEDKTLAVNPDEAETVERIFNMALQTDKYPSALSIAKELRARGVPTRDRNYENRDVNGVWAHSHIQSTLTDPIYKGEGRNVTIAGETFNIPAPAIVDSDIWNQAQKVVERRRKTYSVGGAAKRIYALGGRIIHDHGDGETFTMRGETKIRKATEDHPYEFKRRYYRCSAVREPNGDCPGTHVDKDGPRRTTVVADDVESRVLLWALSLIDSPDVFAEAIEDRRRAELAAESDAEAREALQDQLEAIPVKQARANELYVDGVWDREQYDSKLIELDEEAERLEDELAILGAKLDPADIIERLQTMPVGEWKPEPGDFNPGDAEWPQVANWLRSHVEAYAENGDPLPEIVHAWVAHVVDTLDLRVIVHDRENIEANGGVVRSALTADKTLYSSGTSQPNDRKVEFSVAV